MATYYKNRPKAHISDILKANPSSTNAPTLSEYCTISINSAVTRHTHFFLTPEIIFSRFFRFSEIFQKCGKVTCWPN
jgi:hypothetical protein